MAHGHLKSSLTQFQSWGSMSQGSIQGLCEHTERGGGGEDTMLGHCAMYPLSGTKALSSLGCCDDRARLRVHSRTYTEVVAWYFRLQVTTGSNTEDRCNVADLQPLNSSHHRPLSTYRTCPMSVVLRFKTSDPGMTPSASDSYPPCHVKSC